MGKALYRKYRSKKLSEIVGQEHITKTLSNALKTGRISHAYLFTGPKGVGKTSIARILAHEVNGLPYDEEGTNLDIIEIDAASNRRIDEIRELRDKIHITPAGAKYKVYIIDEVHMLTREAFNALLKTLEEPPEHAIFILATTEAHKLPETIISRTQRFTFKPIDDIEAVKHLQTIAKQEGIKISDEALELIARHGGGSFRDSISLLDQASTVKDDISLDDIRSMLGIPPTERVTRLLESVTSGSPKAVIAELDSLKADGYNATNLAKQLSVQLRQQLLDGQLALDRHEAMKLMEELLKVPAATDSEGLLELAVIGTALALDETMPPEAAVKARPPQTPAKAELKAAIPEVKIKAPKPDPKKPATNIKTEDFEVNWQAVLKELKSRHNTLYGILRMAKPSLTNGKIRLEFGFAFHQKRITEAANKEKIVQIIEAVFGLPIAVECILGQKPLPEAEPAKPDSPKDLEAISNIFGGGEVVD